MLDSKLQRPCSSLRQGADEPEPSIYSIENEQLIQLVLGVFHHSLIVRNRPSRLRELTLVDVASRTRFVTRLPADARACGLAGLGYLLLVQASVAFHPRSYPAVQPSGLFLLSNDIGLRL